MDKFKKFKELMLSIYGEKVFSALTITDNVSIALKSREEIKYIIDRDKGNLTTDKACKKCKLGVYRKMDFVSWLGKLDFNSQHIKKIMMIGEDVSPRVQTYINISYGLGRYEIKPEGRMEEERGNKLWIDLNYLFDNELKLVKNNIYISDIAKCNAHKDKKVWESCSNNYLLNEINLINPKIIIFQGNTSYRFTKKLFKEKELSWEEQPIDEFFVEKTFPKFGYVKLPNNYEATFIKICHSSMANENCKKNYREKYKKLIADRIIPLLY